MAEHWQIVSAIGTIIAGCVGLATFVNKRLSSVSDNILGTMIIRFDGVDKRLTNLESSHHELSGRAQTNAEKIARMEARHEAEDRTVRPVREVRA